MSNLIEVKDLTIPYQEESILNGLSFQVQKGEKVAIVGPSGTGKSSLLNALCGFIPNVQGSIRLFGHELSQDTINQIRSSVSWLPQDVTIHASSVEELLLTPFQFEQNKANTPNQNEVLEAINWLELPENILKKPTNEISGGQKQRILLATTLLLKKPLIILDEPTSALDEKLRNKITDTLLNQPELTIIASTHDEYWISQSSKIIRL